MGGKRKHPSKISRTTQEKAPLPPFPLFLTSPPSPSPQISSFFLLPNTKTQSPQSFTHKVSMEVSTKQLLPMPQQDPNSPSSSTTSSSSSTSPSHQHHRAQPHPSLPPSPRPVPRTIDTTPFPTTFVQADTASFKQVVQMLTGAEQSSKNATATTTAGNSSAGVGGSQAANGPCGPKKPAFKLYERRSSLKNLKMIAPLAMGAPPSPRKVATPEILSPSVLDFPSLKLSPVTPLTGDPFNRSPASSSEEAERAAIAEKGFFLHPSPRGAEPPRLLPLFPVTSPRMTASAAAPSE